MRLQMHKNSLFVILLRSPWWMSLIVAGGLFGLLRLFVPALYASFFALPFLGVAFFAAWKQLRAPSAKSIEAKLEAARAMDAKTFAEALAAGFRREGYEVTRLDGADADFELERSGTRILVASKRWKAARTGVEPLRQLKAAARERRADCIYIAAGELSPVAATFAAENGIRIFSGADLAKTL